MVMMHLVLRPLSYYCWWHSS